MRLNKRKAAGREKKEEMKIDRKADRMTLSQIRTARVIWTCVYLFIIFYDFISICGLFSSLHLFFCPVKVDRFFFINPVMIKIILAPFCANNKQLIINNV